MGESTEADEILAAALLDDAAAHESGAHDRIAMGYDDVYAQLLPIQDLRVRRFSIAFHFWDGWCDARNHKWLVTPGILETDWPKLARHIAERLRRGEDATDPRLIERFAPENLVPLYRRLWKWVKSLWPASK
jgi:hypothetical protein